MRLVGHLNDERLASRFNSFLYSRDIENQVEQDEDGLWEVWILDDAHLEAAGSFLKDFTRSPDDPVFSEGARLGSKSKKQDERLQVRSQNRVVDGSLMFSRPSVPYGIVTMMLIAISVGVGLLTYLGENQDYVQKLLITQYTVEGQFMHWDSTLPEIRQGQVWRILSPIFLHFGIIHIIFNMLWLRDLGSMVEARKGIWLLLALVLVIGATSNIAQFYMSGPNFGGMSGVVYGLLGYVWMQGRFNRSSQLGIHKRIVTMMVIWFFVCLTGIMGPIANTTHAVGLGLGIVWGYSTARLFPGA